jgi:hypothetical protein
MQPAPSNKIAELPVVRVGEDTPQHTEYVVFYPAGFAFSGGFDVYGLQVNIELEAK